MTWSFFKNSGHEKVSIQKDTLPGLITSFAGSSAPSGWILCDGSDVSRTTYNDLFGQVGTTYGVGDGSTTFALPDFKGRVPMGAQAGLADSSTTVLTGTGSVTGGTAIAASALGTKSGVESVTITAAQSGLPAHNHSNSVASHNHGVTNVSHQHEIGYVSWNIDNGNGSVVKAMASGGNEYTYTSGPQSGMNPSAATQSSNYNTTNFSGTADAASSHNNLQEFLVLTFIIKT